MQPPISLRSPYWVSVPVRWWGYANGFSPFPTLWPTFCPMGGCSGVRW